METTDGFLVPGVSLFVLFYFFTLFTFVYSTIKFWAITFDHIETEIWAFFELKKVEFKYKSWNQNSKPDVKLTPLWDANQQTVYGRD